VVHLAADELGDERTPLVGRNVIAPFREHHVHPTAMTEHGVMETNGDSALAVLPILLAGVWLAPSTPTVATFALHVGLLSFSVAILLTNQIHQWSHARHAPCSSAMVAAARSGPLACAPRAAPSPARPRLLHHGRMVRSHAGPAPLLSPSPPELALKEDPKNTSITIAGWVHQNVTSDPRALAWFDNAECEPRIRRAYRDLLSGYEVDPASVLKTTRTLTEDEPRGVVTVSDITFFSICAHHFLPFFGHASLAYLPGKRILGLGKLPRLVDALARRFMIQEDLTAQLAETLLTAGEARGVRVVTEARHLCMCGRGPAQPGASTRVEVALGEQFA
jgi:GTP cyclohydrolase I